MTKAIILYWAFASGSILGLSLLVHAVGWWILPAMAVTSITVMCVFFHRICREA